MFENAELARTLNDETRVNRLGLALSGYFSLLVLAIVIMAEDLQRGVDPARIADSFLIGLIGFHFAVSLLFALMRGGAAIARDKETDTLDSQRLTAMTPREIAFGKLLGLTAPLHAVNLLGLVMALPAAAIAHRSVELTLVVWMILGAATLFYCALGLFVSTSADKADLGARRAIGTGVVLTGACAGLAVPVLECVSPLPALVHLFGNFSEPDRYWPSLCGLGIPVEGLTLLFYVLGAWALMTGVARHIGDPDRPHWTRKQMLGALVGTIGTGLVFLLGYPIGSAIQGQDVPVAAAAYECCLLMALVACAIVMTPDRRRTEADAWRGPDTWNELVLGERGSPMPFLLLVASIAGILPAVFFLPKFAGLKVPEDRLMAVTIAGLALTFLAVKLAGNLMRWFTLVLKEGGALATILALGALCFGPMFGGMLLVDRWEQHLPSLLSTNPGFVLFYISSCSGKQNFASITILMFCFASTVSCALASRKSKALVESVDARRRSLYSAEG